MRRGNNAASRGCNRKRDTRDRWSRGGTLRHTDSAPSSCYTETADERGGRVGPARRALVAALAKRLDTVPGIGPVAIAAIAAWLPELGRLDRGKIAALVGVAPYDADSGERRGQRYIWGGRMKLRNILYMATMAASIRHNPVLPPTTRGCGRTARRPRSRSSLACGSCYHPQYHDRSRAGLAAERRDLSRPGDPRMSEAKPWPTLGRRTAPTAWRTNRNGRAAGSLPKPPRFRIQLLILPLRPQGRRGVSERISFDLIPLRF
jgi:hypothetical protein